jgi:DNA-binding CsgD family transcriptional regulator
VSWKRPLIAVGNRQLERRIRRAFRALANRENGNSPRASASRASDARRIAVLGSRKLSELQWKQPARLQFLQERAWLVVALEDHDPGRVIDALRLGDGFIFSHDSSARLPLIISLVRMGYCVIPPALVPVLARGQLRLELLRRLTPAQAKAFHLLSLGLTNESIARALHLDQARTKYLIRSMLRTLHLRNRTQAAVLAARDAFPFRSDRRDALARAPETPADDPVLH